MDEDQKEKKRERDRAYHRRPEIRERDLQRAKERYARPEVRECHREIASKSARKRYTQPEVQARRRAYLERPEVQEHRREYEHKRAKYPMRPVLRERKSIRDREYYKRPEVRAHRRTYHNRPEVRERYTLHYRNRKSRKKAIEGSCTIEQIQEKLKRQRYRCYYAACGHAKFEKQKGRYVYHIEHTFPLSRVVGMNIPANDISYIMLACPTCNLSKHDKYPWEFPQGGRLL